MASQPNKKKHHYVPVTYLRRFTNADGCLYVYRKDDPRKVLTARPESIGYHNYFYSQPLPDGGQDNNALEDFFSSVEAGWPTLADKLVSRHRLDRQDMIELHGFIGIQRVRVPAARDVAEGALAHDVMQTLLDLKAAGGLPPPPEEFPDLLANIAVTIDPHQSIHAMAGHLRELGPLLDAMGYEILHNETGLSFITSDNPVAYFDPTVSEKAVAPYRIEQGGPVELIFPVSPQIVVRGHHELRGRFVDKGPRHERLRDEHAVRRINRFTARFAYQQIFAADRQHDALVVSYAANSPTVRITEKSPESAGRLNLSFGPRVPKHKWTK